MKELDCIFHTTSSQYASDADYLSAESHLSRLRYNICDLKNMANVSIKHIEAHLKSRLNRITCLEETNQRLNNELYALKDSFLYFNVNDEMDAEERIKYQQQFIQQEMEIRNLRESNQQLQHLLDKYRSQQDLLFINARRIKDGEDIFQRSDDDDIITDHPVQGDDLP